MSDGEEEISDAEKLQISQHFLLSSPPGQFQEVLTDVQMLLPPDLLSESLTAGIARAFNTKTLRVATAPSGSKVVLSSGNEVDPTHYLDNQNTVFAVDHNSMETSEDGLVHEAEEGPLNDCRSALQQALKAYMVQGRFPSPQSAGSVHIKNGNIHVNISAEKPNLRNFWSGKWSSSWVVTMPPDNVFSSAASIAGEIKIHAHYFEDGNVQMMSSKPIPSAALGNCSDTSSLVAAVMAHIKSTESSMQSNLEEMYSNMSEETFKAMRRTMPITRTKMDWNLNSVRMVRAVRK